MNENWQTKNKKTYTDMLKQLEKFKMAAKAKKERENPKKTDKK